MGAGAAVSTSSDAAVSMEHMSCTQFEQQVRWLREVFLKEKMEKDWIRQRYEQVEKDLTDKEDEIQRLRTELDVLRSHCGGVCPDIRFAGADDFSNRLSVLASPCSASSTPSKGSSLCSRRGMSLQDIRISDSGTKAKATDALAMVKSRSTGTDDSLARGGHGLQREPVSPLLMRRKQEQIRVRFGIMPNRNAATSAAEAVQRPGNTQGCEVRDPIQPTGSRKVENSPDLHVTTTKEAMIESPASPKRALRSESSFEQILDEVWAATPEP